MRQPRTLAFTPKILVAIAVLLLSALPLAAQCQMQFNMSLYNDPSVSADFSTVYDSFNAVDNSTLCSCSHSGYEATAQIYSPSGVNSSQEEGGLESYASISTNGQLGNYSTVGLMAFNCSCFGPIQAGSGGGQPVKGAAGCSISFSPGAFTAACNGSQNNGRYYVTFTPTTAQSCFVSSPTCSASVTSLQNGSNLELSSSQNPNPTCNTLSGAIYGSVYYFTGFNPPPPTGTNEGTIAVTLDFTLNSTQVNDPGNAVSVVCQ
jgi:hypothetical protein